MSNPRILLAVLAASIAVAPASAQRPREQTSAFKDAQRGKIMPLRRIEQAARAHPMARGVDRFDPEFDEAATTYTLKFMRGGRVAWIELDARNGRVLRTSGD